MDRSIVVTVSVIVCVLLVVGCGVSETVVVTGIAATNAKNQMEALNGIQFKPKAGVAENKVREAVALYEASTGFLPASLQDLIDKGYLPALPEMPEGLEIRYDRITGVVGSGPLTDSAPVAIPKNPIIEQTEYLTGLAPHIRNGRYVAPRANTSGAAAPAAQSRPASANRGSPVRSRGGGGMGGVGPMGEVMTGIGIQNELNSMNMSGSSSAGSYARHGIGQKTSNYSQRQEQVLKDTGF